MPPETQESITIECVDPPGVIARISVLFWRHGLEITRLSSRDSVGNPDGRTLTITFDLAPNLSAAFVIKRLNRIVGITKIVRRAQPDHRGAPSSRTRRVDVS